MVLHKPLRHRLLWWVLAAWLVLAQSWALAHVDDAEQLGEQHRCSLCHHHQHLAKALASTPPQVAQIKLWVPQPQPYAPRLLAVHSLVQRARGPPLSC